MSRRIGRWAYNSDSTQYGEAGWRLDGTPVVIDYMPGCQGGCNPGGRCGGYLLYGWPGRWEGEQVDRYLRGAMEQIEQEWDESGYLTLNGEVFP
jgi:hypothetical protein